MRIIRRVGFFKSFMKTDESVRKPDNSKIIIPSIEHDYLVPRLQITKLKTGIKVITESIVFPTSVHIGIIFKSGTRNDFSSNNILQSIQNTFLSHLSPDSLKQLDLSASDFRMHFDQESTVFQGHSLSQDSIKLLKIFNETLSISSKYTQSSTPIIQQKFEDFWRRKRRTKESIDKIAQELNLQHCLKGGLEFPISGNEEIPPTQISHSQFLEEYHTTENMLVYAGGVYTHSEFVELVSQEIKKPPSIFQEKCSKVHIPRSFVDFPMRCPSIIIQ